MALLKFCFFFRAKLSRVEGGILSMLSTNEAATLYIDQEELNPADLNLQDAALMTATSETDLEMASLKKTD